MTNADNPADILGRRLVAEVAVYIRLQPNRWVMLGDIVPKLGVSWEEAVAAAEYAAAKPREWIEHNTHSLMLRQAGREMLEEHRPGCMPGGTPAGRASRAPSHGQTSRANYRVA